MPAHIREQIAKRRRLRKRWQRDRHPATRRAFNRQCEIVKRLLFDYRSETWNAYLSGLDLGDGSAWRLAKILRSEKKTNQPLRGERGLVYTAAEKAEAFADAMEDQFTPNADIFDDDHCDYVEGYLDEFFSAQPEDELPEVTVEEVEDLIARSKPRKAAGLDGVGSRALREAPMCFLVFLVSVFNAALRLRHFPDCWKVAKIVLIPKPGKSRLFPQNFRPISLLSTISKLFEKVLLSRLSPYLDGFIRPEQFGFRRGHSTTQQLVRVVNKLVDNHNHNLCSVAVLLDVSKAFDKVWHDGLLFKLSQSPLPDAAVHLLRSYLTGRTFRTSVDGELSTARPIEAGVPQGSVLGPVLYLVFTNDMPTVPGVTLSLYADDAMFMCRSARPDRAARVMQSQMDELSPWLEKWRIAVNADKSQAICFRKRRRMPRAAPEPVTLDGQPIEWTGRVKYLGVLFDSRLTFAAHAQHKLTEARKLTGLLDPLIGRRSTLPRGTRVTIFLACVRSAVLYACTAWWALCSRTNRTKLQAVQNKFLRRVTKQPWFVRNETIRRGLHVPTMEEFARKASERLLRNAASSDLPHIAEIAARNGPPEDFRPRPAAVLDFDPP